MLRDLFEDLIAPMLCFCFTLVFIILSIYGIVLGISTFFESKECKVWGGEFSIYTGCLVKYNNRLLPLEKYKNISEVEITQPIPHNVNITKGGDNE